MSGPLCPESFPEFQHFFTKGCVKSKSRLLFSNGPSVLCGGKKEREKKGKKKNFTSLHFYLLLKCDSDEQMNLK